VQRKQRRIQIFGKKPVYSDNVDAVFLRWRETIEKAISDKFYSGGLTDDGSVHLFLKDLTKRRE
jgi:hypothetical protein